MHSRTHPLSLFVLCHAVWMSSNQGVTWQAQTLAAPWDIRDSIMGAAYYSTQLQKTIIISSGGHDDTTLNFRPNEVWASSDLGVSWTLFPRAPYIGRNHAAMVAASNGVLVVVGGKSDLVGTNTLLNTTNKNLGLNDIWTSVNGGVSWSLCTGLANFPPRQDHAVTMDSAGYLYVTSGINGVNATDMADMWQSSITFLNLQSVSQACGVQIPACGVGLRCWPTPGRPYTCPCDFAVSGEETPAQSQLQLTPLSSPFSATGAASVIPTCAVPAVPTVVSTSPFLLLSWSFCYQTGAASGSVNGPYSVVYEGQLTTQGNLTYSPVTGNAGYLITAVTGSRTQVSSSGVISSSAIIGIGSLPLAAAIPSGAPQVSDPYLYPSAPVAKTATSTATLSTAGIVLLLDTAAILPSGVQVTQSTETGRAAPQQWLRAVSGQGATYVIEAYQSALSSLTTARTTAVLPDYAVMTILSISAQDYVSEAVTLPSCPLNFTVFSSSSNSATTSYAMCATAVSSVSSTASPWALAQSAVITVSSFPQFSASTGLYSFPIISMQTGSYLQSVQGVNTSASSAAVSSFGTSPQLYLSPLGQWSLDTTGASFTLSSAVRLPSSSSVAQSQAVLTLQGSIPSPALSSIALTFAAPTTTTPWTVRHVPGFTFVTRPLSVIDGSGNALTITPPLGAIMYGGQNLTNLFTDIWVSTNAAQTWTLVSGQGSTSQQQAISAPFSALDGSIKIRDSLGRFYLLSGGYNQSVQYSDDGLHWNYTAVPFHGRAYCGAVADPFARIFVFGGQGVVDDHTGATGTYLNDGQLTHTQ
jgi:hypothetical protein